MEEEMKLFKESVEFLEKMSVTKKDDDPVKMENRNILTVVRKKLEDVHRDLRDKIKSSATDVSYLIIQDSKSEVIKELNEVCNKLSNLSVQDDVQKYVDSLQHDDDYSYDDAAADVDVDVDDDVDDDDCDDDGAIVFYLEAVKILTLDFKHYDQTLQFIKELVTTAEKERVSECDHDQLLLLRAYHTIARVRADLYHTSNAHMSSSVWCEDLTLMISKSRSLVENQLNVICNNLSNLTIKERLFSAPG